MIGALAVISLATSPRSPPRCTHLFNAMPSFDHLEPGLVCVLGLTSCRPFFGLIADGVHVHPASLKIAARARIDSVVRSPRSYGPLASRLRPLSLAATAP